MSAGKAESRRAVSGTLLNDVSSRSHMILTLTVKARVMSIAVQKLKILIRRNIVTFLYEQDFQGDLLFQMRTFSLCINCETNKIIGLRIL